jgi:hypothetical protein
MQGDRNAIPGGKRHVGSRGSNDLSQARSTSTTDQAISPLRRCMIGDVVSTPRPGSPVLARLQDHPAKRIDELQLLELEGRAAKKPPRSRFAAAVCAVNCLSRSSPAFTGCVRFGWLPAIRRSRPRRPPHQPWLLPPASRDLANRRFAIVAEVSEGRLDAS